MERSKVFTEIGSKQAPETFYIKITADGPYMIYGRPPIDQEIIVKNEEGASWEYRKGLKFDSSQEPTALCRCGASKNAPYCDGSHVGLRWDPRETNNKRPLLEGAQTFEGPTMILADNEKYCAFARFCDAYGRIWNIVQRAGTEEEKELVRHEAGHCPAGRLVVYDKEKKEVYEPAFEPSIGVIEDPGIRVSGPLWVKGGIRIESADGKSYEIRNRVTLCRCGMSSNKPFCNGAHASIHFKDGLPLGEEQK
jgi:Uncharacterized conserved protein